MSIITLTTDFGSSDPFFGIMKGVILNICPDARIEDITHDIEPQNIHQANFVIRSSYHYFPKNTIHICVVDPGVGSARKPILIQTENYLFVGPDNGIFTGIIEKEKITNVIELTEKKYWLKTISQTFHGRDIFSPVAAHLAKGENVLNLGKKINTEGLTRLNISRPIKKKDGYTGTVQFIDHFGNIITNVPNDEVQGNITGKVKNNDFKGLVLNFSEANSNNLHAIKGSSGYIEIFINQGNAGKFTGAKIGDTVNIIYVNAP